MCWLYWHRRLSLYWGIWSLDGAAIRKSRSLKRLVLQGGCLLLLLGLLWFLLLLFEPVVLNGWGGAEGLWSVDGAAWMTGNQTFGVFGTQGGFLPLLLPLLLSWFHRSGVCRGLMISYFVTCWGQSMLVGRLLQSPSQS